MRKILIVLLALIALLVVGWFGVYQMKAPDIETDIKTRVGEALSDNSLDWVSYDVDGRDVTLSGEAQTQEMADYALETADIYGLNSLENKISVSGQGASEQTDTAANDQDSTGDASSADGEDAKAPTETAEANATDAQAADGDAQTDDAQADNADNKDAAGSAEADAASAGVADVAVQDVETKGVAALPITMNISKDSSGEYIFNGTVPNMEFKKAVDEHMTAVGADPAKAVWQVEMSSAEPPANWQPNILNSISTIHELQDGEINLTADQAIVKGTATSQDMSDTAEGFAQKIAGDYETEMNISIASTEQAGNAAGAAEDLPLVGSDQYAAKFCQTELDSLLKQQKITFDSGSTNLQGTSLALLDKVSLVSGRCPNQVIQVHGYTDSQGPASANLKLSEGRAGAVVEYLLKQGMESARLVAIGHGEKRPVATNKTKAGRAQNRRIKLIVKGLKK